jgi:hypothetical protein
MRRIWTCLTAAAFVLAAAMPGFAAVPETGMRAGDSPPKIDGGIQIAANKTYKFVNPFPFDVYIKIYGSGSAYPKVKKIPAPPAPFVPIPYPDTSMKIKIKKVGGGWSKKFTIKWKSKKIALPAF